MAKKSGAFHIHKADVQCSKASQYYFTMHSANGKVLFTSEMYDAIQGCERGIDAIERVFVGHGWTKPAVSIPRHRHF